MDEPNGVLTGVNILLILRIVSWSFLGWNSRGLQACFLKFKPNCSEIRIPDGVCWREECGNKWSHKLVRNSIFLVWKDDVWEVPTSATCHIAFSLPENAIPWIHILEVQKNSTPGWFEILSTISKSQQVWNSDFFALHTVAPIQKSGMLQC